MITEKEQQLKINGIKLVPLWHFVVILLVLLISMGINYGIGVSRINQVEKDVDVLKHWKDSHEKEVTELRIRIEARLSTIESNIIANTDKLNWLIKNNK